MKTVVDKPAKPYADFPLFAHATKRWAKKIRGKMHYFGPWSNPEGAIEKYQQQREDLYAGRVPRSTCDGLTVRELVNRFLTAKKLLVDTHELTPRTFADYHATCERIVDAFSDRLANDLAAEDFEKLRARVAKKWGPVALGNEVSRVRVVFKYGYDANLIDKPVKFGPHFKRPSKKILRRARRERGPRMFEPNDVKNLINAATVSVKAMILLGINCGFGNADVGTLPMSALNLKGHWVDYPRPKTEILRRAPLWAETLKALKAAIAVRPKPKDEAHSDLVFLTKYGEPWAKDTRDNPVSKEIAKLLIDLGIHRPGLGFYALRHTFETIGGEVHDQAAVDYIMGHAPHGNDMSAVYRERITDDRLRRVTDHIHDWLFAAERKNKTSRTHNKKKLKPKMN